MSKKNIKIGADPELIISKNGLLAELLCIDKIDLDGSDECHEIRPAPSENPLEVVANIHNLFIEQIKGDKDSFNNHWAAGGFYGHPLGGHIHFSFDNSAREIDAYNFIAGMEQYLGVICLLLEKRKDGMKRRSTYWNYGKFESSRVGRTIEMRSPSSWLTSPQIASAVLCLAKIIAHEIVNNNFQYKRYVNAHQFNRMVIPEIHPQFPAIWKEIEKMELFEEYKEHLEIIPYLINNKLTWFPKCSMKQAWGLVQFEQLPPKNKMTFSKIWDSWNRLINPVTVNQ